MNQVRELAQSTSYYVHSLDRQWPAICQPGAGPTTKLRDCARLRETARDCARLRERGREETLTYVGWFFLCR